MSKGPWYKSFWKVLIMLVVLFIVLIGTLLALMVFQEYQRIQQGELPSYLIGADLNQNTNAATGYKPTTGDDPYLGNINATVKIISFEDYQCPFCQRSHEVIKSVIESYPNDVLYVARDFPLETIHQQAFEAAMASECADDQGRYWDYRDLLFENQEYFSQPNTFKDLAEQLGMDTVVFEECLSSEKHRDEVMQDKDEGLLAQVTSTPTFFVNDTKLEGLYSEADWINIIETVLGYNTGILSIPQPTSTDTNVNSDTTAGEDSVTETEASSDEETTEETVVEEQAE